MGASQRNAAFVRGRHALDLVLEPLEFVQKIKEDLCPRGHGRLPTVKAGARDTLLMPLSLSRQRPKDEADDGTNGKPFRVGASTFAGRAALARKTLRCTHFRWRGLGIAGSGTRIAAEPRGDGPLLRNVQRRSPFGGSNRVSARRASEQKFQLSRDCGDIMVLLFDRTPSHGFSGVALRDTVALPFVADTVAKGH
jgi:hypothetical protein